MTAKAGDTVLIDGVEYKRHPSHFSLLVSPTGEVFNRSGLDRIALEKRYFDEHQERMAAQQLKRKAVA